MRYFKITLAALFSLIFIIGATFGVMYLTGSFDKDIIRPQEISFDFSSYELDYDEDNNFNTMMTVTSTTVGVTEKDINLSFINANIETIELENDYISDGIIIVPKSVQIGVPFQVLPFTKLYGTTVSDPNYDPAYPDGWEWIAGGISNLKAESSSNILLGAAFTEARVDIPVRNIEVQTLTNNNAQTTSFAVGSVISLSAKFFPAESENALGVRKNVLFEIKDHQANILDFDREAEAFAIDTTKFFNSIKVFSQTNENPIDIEAYTFKTIIEQRRAIVEGYSESQLLIEMGQTKTSLSEQVPVNEDPKDYLLSFFEPVVADFSISSEWTQYNKISLGFNKLVVLYANNSSIDNGMSTNEFDLGLNIRANNEQELPGKISNIIMIPESSLDGFTWIYDDGNISGEDTKVQILNTEQVAIDLSEENNVVGYKVDEYSSWRIVGQAQTEYFRFRIVYVLDDQTLLKDEENSAYSKFIYLTVPSANIQVELTWTDSKPEVLEIMKSENAGETTYPSLDLRSILSMNPTNSVYQSIRYFVKGNEENVFTVNQIVDATYYGMINDIEVFELNPYADGVLTGLKSGKISVFAAIIKTDYAGNPVFDGENYIFVSSTSDKAFEFTELISILNISLEGGIFSGEERYDLNEITQETDNAVIVRVSLPTENGDLYKESFINAYNAGEILVWSSCLTTGESTSINLLQFQRIMTEDLETGVLKLLFNVTKFPDTVTRDDLTFRINISYSANIHVQINYGVRNFTVISGLAGGVFFDVTKNPDGTESGIGTSPESRIKIEAAFSQASQTYTVTSNTIDVKESFFETVDNGGISTLTTIPKVGFVNESAHSSFKIYTITSSDPSVCEIRTQSIGNQVSYFLEYQASDSVEHNFTLTVRLSSLKENDKYQLIYLSYKGPNAIWQTEIVDTYDVYGNSGEIVQIPSLIRLTNNLEGESREDYTAQFVTFSTSYVQEPTNPPIILEIDGIQNYEGQDEQYTGVTAITISTYIYQEIKIVVNCATEFGFYFSFEIKIMPCINFSTSMTSIKAEDEDDANALPVAYSSTSHIISVFADNPVKSPTANFFYNNLYLEVALATNPSNILVGPFEIYDRPLTDVDLFRYYLNPTKEGETITTPLVELFFGAVGEQVTLRIFFKFTNIPDFIQYVDVILKPNIENCTIESNSTNGSAITNDLNAPNVEYFSGDNIQLLSQDGLQGANDSGDKLSFTRLPITLAQSKIVLTDYYFDLSNASFQLYAYSTVYDTYVLINSQLLENKYSARIVLSEDLTKYVLQILPGLSRETIFKIEFIYAGGASIVFQLIAQPNLKPIKVETEVIGGETVYTLIDFEQTLYNGEKYRKVVAAEQGVDFSVIPSADGIDFLTGNFSERVTDGFGVTHLQIIDKAYLSAEMVTEGISSYAKMHLSNNNLLINLPEFSTTIRTFVVVVNKLDPDNTDVILAQITVKFLLLPYDVERMVSYTDMTLENTDGVDLDDIYQVLSNENIFATYEGGSGTVNLLSSDNSAPVSILLDFVKPDNNAESYSKSFTLLNHTDIVGLSISPNGDFVCPALPEQNVVLIEVKMTDVSGVNAYKFTIRIKVTASLTAQILFPYDVSQSATAEWRVFSGSSLVIDFNEKFASDVPAYLQGKSVTAGQRQRVMFFSNQNSYMNTLSLTYSIFEVWNEVNEEGENGDQLTAEQISSIVSITSNGVLTINKQVNVNSVKVVVKITTLYGLSVNYIIIAEVEPSSNYELTGPVSYSLLAGVPALDLVPAEGETATSSQFSLFNNTEFVIGDVTDELGFFVVNSSYNSFSISALSRTSLMVGEIVPINPIQKFLIVFTKYGVIRTVPLVLNSDFNLEFNGEVVAASEIKSLDVFSDSEVNILDLLKLYDLNGNEVLLQEDDTDYLSDYNVTLSKTKYTVPTGEKNIFEMVEGTENVNITSGGRFKINPLVSEQTVRVSADFSGKVVKKIGLSSISLYSGSIVETSTDGLTLSTLEFETLPNRAYFQDDEISHESFSALKVVGLYSDGNYRRISATTEELIGTLPTSEKTGTKTVSVSYGGMSIDFDIAVFKKNTELNIAPDVFNLTEAVGDLTNIFVRALPSVTSYFLNDTLNTTGLEIVGEYQDEQAIKTYAVLDGWTTDVSMATASKNATVTISYGAFTTSYNIEIIDPTAVNSEEILVNSSDPLRITFDLNIYPNIEPVETENLDYLKIETYSNQTEYGFEIPFSDIFAVNSPDSYFLTSDITANPNKHYFTKNNEIYEKFVGEFDSGVQYFELSNLGYLTEYEILSGEYVTIASSQELAASFISGGAQNTITHSNQSLFVFIGAVAFEHTVTIQATTIYGHVNIIHLVISPDVGITVNYPGNSTFETIYYDDYLNSATFNLREAPELFSKQRVETIGMIGESTEVAETRFVIKSISCTDQTITSNIVDFPANVTEAEYIIGAFTLTVSKYGSFVIKSFDAAEYKVTPIRIVVEIDGIQRLFYDVRITNVPVYTFESALTDPSRIEAGRELFATKPTSEKEDVFTNETVGIGKKYAIKYLGINISSLNNFDTEYLSKIFVKNYPANTTTSMAEFAILAGITTSTSGVSLQFGFEGQKSWSTTHQIKVVWDYLIRNTSINVYAGVETSIIDAANITERFSSTKLNLEDVVINGTSRTESNTVWFTYISSLKTFKAKHVNGTVAQTLSLEAYGNYEEIQVNVVQTADIQLVDRTLSEIYFFDEENLPVDVLTMNVYETSTTSSFLELSYTNGAVNPAFVGGDSISYQIIVIDDQGEIVYDEFDHLVANPFGYLSIDFKTLTFVKPMFSRQQVVLRITHEFYVKDFEFYCSAETANQLVFQNNDEIGYYEGDVLPTETGVIPTSNPAQYYPYTNDPSASWIPTTFVIDYEAVSYAKGLLVEQEEGTHNYSIALLGNEFFKDGNEYADKNEQIRVTVSVTYMGPNDIDITEKAIQITTVLIKQRYSPTFVYATGETQVVRNGISFDPIFQIYDNKLERNVINSDLGIIFNPNGTYTKTFESEELYAAQYETNGLSEQIVKAYAFENDIPEYLGGPTNYINFVVNVNYKVAPIYSSIVRTAPLTTVNELFSDWKDSYSFIYKNGANNDTVLSPNNVESSKLYFNLESGTTNKVYVDEFGNIANLWSVGESETQVISIVEKLTGYLVGTISVLRANPAQYSVAVDGVTSTNFLFEAVYGHDLSSTDVTIDGNAIDFSGLSFTENGTYYFGLAFPKPNGVSNRHITVFAKQQDTIVPIAFELTDYDAQMFTYENVTIGGVSGVSITGLKQSVSQLEIPALLGGLPVLAIGNSAFEDETAITSIKIGENVVSIGNYAFYGCTGLESIVVNTNLKSIGDSAFENCSNLLLISLPSSLTSIGASAFKNCSNLQVVKISKATVTLTLGDEAFAYCTSLITIYIPNGLTLLNSGVFSNCTNLAEFTIEENHSAFTVVNGNLLSKSQSVFIQYAPGKVDTIFITPTLVTEIADGAFKGAEKLESITIRNIVTKIGDYAFVGIGGDNNVSIVFEENSTVESIGYSAFAEIKKLNQVVLSSDIAPVLKGLKGVGFNDLTALIDYTGERPLDPTIFVPNKSHYLGLASIGWTDELLKYVSNNPTPEKFFITSESSSFMTITGLTVAGQQLTSITIPSLMTTAVGGYKPVQYIQETVFKGNENLEYVYIPNTVVDITENAFQNCISLKIVEFGNGSGLTTFKANLFDNCTSLTTIKYEDSAENIVKIPENITAVSEYVFNGCNNILSVQVPVGMVSIHETAFLYCSAIMQFAIYDPVTNNLILGPGTGTFFVDSLGRTLGEIVATDNVLRFFAVGNVSTYNCPIECDYTIIGNYAFYNAQNSVIGLTTITKINSFAFAYSKITRITIPFSVTEISDNAFANCNSLTAVTNNSSLALTSAMFGGSSKVTNLTINLSYVENKTIEPYNSFISVSQVKNISIEYAEIISASAFVKYYKFFGIDIIVQNNLETLSFSPDCGLTTIGANAFDSSKISLLALPLSLTTIGTRAFYNCTNLTSLTIPENTSSIGDAAFGGCSQLISIIIKSNTLVLLKNMFTGSSLINTIKFDYIGALSTTSYSIFINSIASIKTISLGAGITEIGTNLIGCVNVSQFEVVSGNTSFASLNYNLVNSTGEILYRYALGRNRSSYTLATSIKHVASSAFASATITKDIYIEADSNLETLADYVFDNSGIRNVYIRKSYSSNFMVGLSVKSDYSEFRIYVSLTSYTSYKAAFEESNSESDVDAFLKPILNETNMSTASSLIQPFHKHITNLTAMSYYGFVLPDKMSSGALTSYFTTESTTGANIVIYSFNNGDLVQINPSSGKYKLTIGWQYIFGISNSTYLSINYDISTMELTENYTLAGSNNHLSMYAFEPLTEQGYFSSKYLKYYIYGYNIGTTKVFTSYGSEINPINLEDDVTYYVCSYRTGTSAFVSIRVQTASTLNNYGNFTASKVANLATFYKFVPSETATYVFTGKSLTPTTYFRKIALYDSEMNLLNDDYGTSNYDASFDYVCYYGTTYYFGIDNRETSKKLENGNIDFSISRDIVRYSNAANLYKAVSFDATGYSYYCIYARFIPTNTSSYGISISSSGSISLRVYNSDFSSEIDPANFVGGTTYYFRLRVSSASATSSYTVYYSSLPLSSRAYIGSDVYVDADQSVEYTYYFIASSYTHSISYSYQEAATMHQKLYNYNYSELETDTSWSGLASGKVYILKVWYTKNLFYWDNINTFYFKVS